MDILFWRKCTHINILRQTKCTAHDNFNTCLLNKKSFYYGLLRGFYLRYYLLLLLITLNTCYFLSFFFTSHDTSIVNFSEFCFLSRGNLQSTVLVQELWLFCTWYSGHLLLSDFKLHNKYMVMLSKIRK